MRMRILIAQRGHFLRGAGALTEKHQCYCQRICEDYFQLNKFTSSERRYQSTWGISSIFGVGGNMGSWVPVKSSPGLNNNTLTQRKGRFYSTSSTTTTTPDDLSGRQVKDLKKIKKVKGASTVFYDSLRIHVKGGIGGLGLPKKGGLGGKGGDIVAVGHKDVTLKTVLTLNPSKRFAAEAGADSKLFCLNGLPGKNTILPVPVGVSVVTELGHKIGEVNKHGEKLIVAKGGMGGHPSNGFSAEKGQSHNVVLDLKLIADVGFVGFPNAGKSTLLKALSRASPKIASYPFTTVRPNIGVVEYPDYRQISLADLPGLIEGAHANVGMGHKFLKHVERTKVLLFVVDIHGFQLSTKFPYRSALETIVLLNKELELYKEELTEKPAVLALNKCDLPGSYQIIKNIIATVNEQNSYENFLKTLSPEIVPENVLLFDKIIPISAKTDPISVNQLKQIIRNVIDINATECAVAIS